MIRPTVGNRLSFFDSNECPVPHQSGVNNIYLHDHIYFLLSGFLIKFILRLSRAGLLIFSFSGKEFAFPEKITLLTAQILGMPKNIIDSFKTFPATFWIANGLELFERLSFYATLAVLAIFIDDKVGLQGEGGKISGWFVSAIYILPVLAGVFVDKYGFRKTLFACFAIFTVGYTTIGLSGLAAGKELAEALGVRNFLLIGLGITAAGGALIKPCIVGTVARTAPEKSRGLGYSIYYTLVNIGGAVGPLMGIPIRRMYGIEFVLILAAGVTLLLTVLTWLFFKEPPDDGSEKKSFDKVFGDMILVFGNIRFLLFLFIFSGFWIMFYQIFLLLPFYVRDVLHFENFEVIESVDAYTIIFLTVPLAALVRKMKPIHAILSGFVLASFAWVVIGWQQSLLFTVAGLFVYAIGEAIQSPRYYEYISTLAPRGQIGTFMGFAFLPIALGSFAAGYLADWLRFNYLHGSQADPMMWFWIAGIGLVTTVLLYLHAVLTRHI